MPAYRFLLAFALVAATWLTALPSLAAPVEQEPNLEFAFTELPSTIRELRFAFSCPDGLEIETRWVAENVGDAAPANFEIAKATLVTKGPLNLARLSRPTNGWPLGLYRLELWRAGKLLHTERYVIDNVDGGQQ